MRETLELGAESASVQELKDHARAMGLLVNDAVEERPWGIWFDWFRSPEATLKCMLVAPGHRMSLQRHQEREEVWRVISGSGEDQGPNPPQPLVPGSTHHVPPGQIHRIANTGSGPLVIVEMQAGNCSEEDIERMEDDYPPHRA